MKLESKASTWQIFAEHMHSTRCCKHSSEQNRYKPLASRSTHFSIKETEADEINEISKQTGKGLLVWTLIWGQ